MNVYDAIMKAADQIEREPHLFNFGATGIPDCGSPGCALGWIGAFAKHKGPYITGVSEEILKLSPEPYGHVGWTAPDFAFYNRMAALDGGFGWKGEAHRCALVLRLYADKYHGHEKPKPVTPPDWQAIASKWTVGDDVRSQELVS